MIIDVVVRVGVVREASSAVVEKELRGALLHGIVEAVHGGIPERRARRYASETRWLIVGPHSSRVVVEDRRRLAFAALLDLPQCRYGVILDVEARHRGGEPFGAFLWAAAARSTVWPGRGVAVRVLAHETLNCDQGEFRQHIEGCVGPWTGLVAGVREHHVTNSVPAPTGLHRARTAAVKD